MDRETLDLLEFDRVLQIIEAQAESLAGKAVVKRIQPFKDPRQAKHQLSQIEEAALFSTRDGRLSCSHLGDLGPVLDALKGNTSLLTTLELLGLLGLLNFVSLAKRSLGCNDWPSLAELFGGATVPPELHGRLSESIDDKGEIRESAYPELAKARRQQNRFRRKVQDHLAKYQQGSKAKYLISEPYVTQRAGRYVIPVRVEHQKNIEGFIHGTSSSGATVFLEPLTSVELNNQYIYFREREREIIRHILTELTQAARLQIDTLTGLMERIAKLDAIFACADFSQRFRCASPELLDKREIKITDGRHPLLVHSLGEEMVIPLSVELNGEENVLVVSGPNNGGKTVALKTVGLFCAMAQAGLPVPAKQVQLPILKNILADVGDHQSIIQHLSTFSSHIKRISELLEKLEVPCLLLLDEAGRGTDPVYGSALAVSVIEHLRAKETLLIATTHHRAVKAYASSTPGVKNASVQLDSVSLKPTYVLEFGVAGSSSGLEIAEQLGLKAEVIAHARRLLDAGELQAENYLKQLRQELQLLEQKNRDLAVRLEELKRRESILERNAAEKESRRAKEFEQRLDHWGNEFRSESSRYLKKLEDRFAAAKVRKEAKRREEALKEAFRRKVKATVVRKGPIEHSGQISVGDTVFHTLFEKRGVVLSLDQNEVKVEISGKKVSAPLDRLEKVTEGEMVRKPSERVTLNVVEDSKSELNLIGQTVDEATGVLDKFLDRAFVSGLKEVRIIHGHGSGKLKSAVSGILKEHPQVQDYQVEGGATRAMLSQ